MNFYAAQGRFRGETSQTPRQSLGCASCSSCKCGPGSLNGFEVSNPLHLGIAAIGLFVAYKLLKR